MDNLTGLTTGTYRVVTRHSLFTLDLDAMTVERSNATVPLPGGLAVFPLLAVVVVVVGRAMVLAVERDGRPDTLSTSVVDVIAAAAPSPRWIRNAGTLGKSHRAADARQQAVPGESNIAACGRVVRNIEAVAFVTTAEQDRCRHCVALAVR